MITITRESQRTELPAVPNWSDGIVQGELPTVEKLNEINLKLEKLKAKTHLLDNVELSEYAIRKLTCA